MLATDVSQKLLSPRLAKNENEKPNPRGNNLHGRGSQFISLSFLTAA
jgi:hypothetical protein